MKQKLDLILNELFELNERVITIENKLITMENKLNTMED